MEHPHIDPNHSQAYVVGFAFQKGTRAHIPHCSNVTLITKEKPAWQKGKLNGVGGKIEDGDRPLCKGAARDQAALAMCREFHEETGVDVLASDWHLFEVMRFGNGVIVWCFTCWLDSQDIPCTMESEIVDRFALNEFGRISDHWNMVPNLRWLIPKAWAELNEPPEARMIVT